MVPAFVDRNLDNAVILDLFSADKQTTALMIITCETLRDTQSPGMGLQPYWSSGLPGRGFWRKHADQRADQRCPAYHRRSF